MQNITELRDKLIQNYELMESQQRSIKLGKELANTAGKIINSCALEHDYNKYKENGREIKFLEPTKKPLEELR